MQTVLLIIIAAVVVAVVAIALFLFSSHGATSVNGSTTLTLKSTPVVIRSGGYQYVLSLAKSNVAAGTVQVYIARSPVLTSQTLDVLVSLNNYTKVNVGTTYANLEMKLDSVNATAAKITLAPLQAYLAVTPNFSEISVVTQPQTGTTTVITTVSTTVSTTTTINQTQANYARILGYLKQNPWYGVMTNQTALYANTVNCGPVQYNSTFIMQTHSAPQPPVDYWNVSVVTPYKMTYNITNVGLGSYAVTYTTTSKFAATTGTALVLTMNLTSGAVSNTVLTGIFKGLSFTTVQALTAQSDGINSACAGYIG